MTGKAIVLSLVAFVLVGAFGFLSRAAAPDPAAMKTLREADTARAVLANALSAPTAPAAVRPSAPVRALQARGSGVKAIPFSAPVNLAPASLKSSEVNETEPTAAPNGAVKGGKTETEEAPGPDEFSVVDTGNMAPPPHVPDNFLTDRTFSAAQGLLAEKEPNDTAAQATPLGGTNVVAKGNIYKLSNGPTAATGDIDVWSFSGNAGDRVYAATMTSWAPSSSTDTTLELVGTDGTTILETDLDDGALGSTSSTIAGTTLPATGTFYVRVRQASNSSRIAPYFLHFRLQSSSPTPETEANDTPATANPLPANGWVSGTHGATTDTDWFSFSASAGDTIYLSLDADPERDNVQWNPRIGVGLFGDAGNQILVIDDASTGTAANPLSEALFMTVKTTGTYYAYIDTTLQTTGGATQTYNLSVSVHPATPIGTNCTVYTSTDVPKTIGPAIGTTTNSTIVVPGNPRIEDLNVSITLDHTIMADIDAALLSPAGNENSIFTDIGAAAVGGQTQMDLDLDDEAGIPPLFTVLKGEGFLPEVAYRLNWLKGELAGGTWTLRLRDDANATNGGNLTAWSITICEPPAPAVCTGTTVTVLSKDFEADNGGFTPSAATTAPWQWGTPTAAPIATCNSGVKCWKTNLTGLYSASANQDLVSPTMNLSGLGAPITLSWAQKYQLESASFDTFWLDVRDVGPTNSTNLFQFLDATMTDSVGSPATTLQETAGWGLATRDISAYANKSAVQLRWGFVSDSSGQFAGAAIDDVTVTACCTAASCNDNNACTDDVCDAVLGCVHTNNDANACSDGNPCTGPDFCSAGVCNSGPNPCNDNNACTVDVCDGAGGCSYTAVNCNDNNACTDDSCVPATGCAHANNTAACTDNNPCTIGDICAGGVCVPGTGALPAAVQYCNNTGISIPSSGTSTPYPSAITVSGASSYLCKVTTDLTGITHTFMTDIDAMLSSPTPATNLIVMSDVGPNGAVTGLNLTLDDSAALPIPVGAVTSGTYKPTNSGAGDPFAAPAPAPSAATTFATFNGVNPNGTWNLWVVDDASGDLGTIFGWCVNLVSVCSTGADCNDGNACTDDACVNSSCTHTNNTASCNDGNACTTGDTCTGGVCVGGPPPSCDDGNVCTTDSCNTGTGVCDNLPIVCNDNNSCTDDLCVGPATGCTYTANNANTCTDNDLCTQTDTCQNGACVGTNLVLCNDGNVCTTDTCNPATGLCVTTNNTAPCDDGNGCTTGDTCQPRFAENFDGVTAPALPAGWTATGTGNPWVTQSTSSDSAPNSAFTDDPAVVTDKLLVSPPIAIASAAAKLSFRNRFSLEGTFDGGVLEIDIAGGGFTDIVTAGGSFVSGGYTGVISTAFSSPISGRSAWTGASAGYPAYLTTNVNLPAAAAGQSIQLRWRVASDTSVANTGQNIDSIFITDPTNVCIGGPAPDCNDNNPCTDDSCNPSTGCVHTNNANACNDGSACTTGDACVGGTCGGTPVVCNDGNNCTIDSCNPSTGCVYTPSPLTVTFSSTGVVTIPTAGNGSPYPSSFVVPSLGGNIVGLTVSLNGLSHTSPQDIDMLLVGPTGADSIIMSDVGGTFPIVGVNLTLADAAANSLPVGAQIFSGTYKPTNNLPGDFFPPPAPPASGNSLLSVFNGTNPAGVWRLFVTDFWSGEEGTLEGWSLHITLNCDDGNPCTTDSCDPVLGCLHTATNCDDGNACTVDSCDPAAGCVHDAAAANGFACNDGNACTTNDACSAGSCVGGPAPNCDDNNSCTVDSCDPAAGCVHDAPAANGLACGDPANTDCDNPDSCLNGVCVPNHEASGSACSDGNACTTADTCDGAGSCVGGPAPNCDDNNVCTVDSCDPTTGCVHDAPAANGLACGNPSDTNCDNPDSCLNGTCVPNYEPSGFACNDGNACTTTDSCDGAGSCVGGPAPNCDDNNACTVDSCDPVTGCVHDAPAANGFVCGNPANTDCDNPDSCLNGVCVGNNEPDGSACSDGNACTQDICSGGACVCPISSGICQGSAATTYNSTDVPKAISATGANTVTSTLTVSGADPYLYDLNVKTFITHTSNGQLQISLKSPAGKIVTLSSQNGGTNDDVFNGTLWNDSADPDSQVPYTNALNIVTDTLYANLTVKPTLSPEEPLGAFIGENPNGVWTLTIADLTTGDGGNLANWSMNLTTLPVAPAATVVTVPSTDVPKTIPTTGPPNVVVSSVLVSVPGTQIGQVRLTDFILHTFASDLDITIKSPAGTVVTLTTDNGGGNDNVFNGTRWDDKVDPGNQVPYVVPLAASFMVTDTAYTNLVVKPTLTPEEALAAFIGENPNGVWTLTISDDASADGGTLTSWSLEITTTTCQVTQCAVNCNDNNPCTDDSCDPATGCVHTNNTSPCNDGVLCTVNDVCGGGACAGTPVVCNDNNVCTDEACNPATGLCVFTNNTNPCDDGNACTTNDTCTAPSVCGSTENFDVVTAPALPSGWTSTVTGTGALWTTVSTSNDTPPNSAFGFDGAVVADEVLVSPPIPILSSTAKLTFRNRWTFEGTATCFDAGVLEIKIGAGSFADIVTAGGSFVSGGYTAIVSASFSNPLAGRSAWCIASAGYPAYLTSVVNLPAAAAGQTIQLRWRVGTDTSVGAAGQNIDSIAISDACAAVCTGGPATDCNDGNACTNDSCDPATGCTHTPTVCDDGNTCTVDTCNPATGCVYTPTPGANCNDGDACTTADKCDATGACIGGPALTCADSNACTNDSCNPATGCVFEPVNCGDGNACTTDACNPASGCTHTTINCYDQNKCTNDSCDPATGCVFTPVSCDDGSACTTDTCDPGSGCRHTTIDCNDHNKCTNDSCDPATGTCVVAPVNCDDGNACTTDACNPASGCSHTAITCNDNNNCTNDSCNPASGCVFTNNTSACTDGNACTTGDTCGGGTCNPGTATVCNDGNGCTTDTCNPATGCIYTNNTNPCSDGNACTTGDTCGGGTCNPGTATVCNDNNGCTNDSCNPATGCVFTNNTNACSDGNACTTGDACDGGTCNPGTATVCNDNNGCTTDTCNPTTGCVFSNNTNSCNDGNACTTGDTCGGGTCNPGTATVCNDNNGCTTDTCNPTTGCVFSNNTNSCNDGNACTTNDTCGGGTCNGGAPPVCNDNNPCTADSCNPATGCVYTPTPGAACNDGNACTTADTCTVFGTCGGATVNCNDNNPCTADSCNPATGCVNTPTPGAACSDGNACTTADTCSATGSCTGGPALNCDDHVACTTDSCVPASGCQHVLDTLITNYCGTTAEVPGATYTTSINGSGDVTIVFTQAVTVNDNSYGANIVNWPRSHTFSDLVGSDKANFVFRNGSGTVVFDFLLDYITAKTGTPSGYASLGVAGGDGSVTTGSAAWLLSWQTSLAANLNNTGYCTGGSCVVSGVNLLSISPPTTPPNTSYNVAPAFSQWIFPIQYTVTISHLAFGSSGFGSVAFPSVHNSPPKIGCNATNYFSCTCTANCDDGDSCTVDTCTGSQCIHSPVPAGGACDDGNACTSNDTCNSLGACVSGPARNCNDSNQCTADSCNPASGCVNSPLPDGTTCDDGNAGTNGETCQGGICPGTNCSQNPAPKSSGYYKKLCENGHGHPSSTDALTAADAACVGQLTATFAGISTVDDICAVYDHDSRGAHDTNGPNCKDCTKADNELMALALNVCRGLVCLSQEVDSSCSGGPGDHTLTTVGASLATTDEILANPARNKTTCKDAGCLAKEVNNGKGIHHTSLLLDKEAGNNVRLNWDSPVMEDGSGQASRYSIWRRPLNDDGPFVQLGTTTGLTFLDSTSGTARWEYEVTFTIEP